jgi:hypothetical protein
VQWQTADLTQELALKSRELTDTQVELAHLQEQAADLRQELTLKSRQLTDTQVELAHLQETTKDLRPAHELELATTMLAQALHAKMINRAEEKAAKALRRRMLGGALGIWGGLVAGRRSAEVLLGHVHVAAAHLSTLVEDGALVHALGWWRHASGMQRLMKRLEAAESEVLEARREAADREVAARAHKSESEAIEMEAKVLSKALLADVEHQRDCLNVAASVQEKSAAILRDKSSEIASLKQALTQRTLSLRHAAVAKSMQGGSERSLRRLSPGRWEPVAVLDAGDWEPSEAPAEDRASTPAPAIATRVGATVGIKLEGLAVSELAPSGPASLSGQISPGDELVSADGVALCVSNVQRLLAGAPLNKRCLGLISRTRSYPEVARVVAAVVEGKGEEAKARWSWWVVPSDLCMALGAAHVILVPPGLAPRAGDDEPGSTVDLVVRKQHTGSLIHVPLKRVPASDLHYPSWHHHPVSATSSGLPAVSAQLVREVRSSRALSHKSACPNGESGGLQRHRRLLAFMARGSCDGIMDMSRWAAEGAECGARFAGLHKRQK